MPSISSISGQNVEFSLYVTEEDKQRVAYFAITVDSKERKIKKCPFLWLTSMIFQTKNLQKFVSQVGLEIKTDLSSLVLECILGPPIDTQETEGVFGELRYLPEVLVIENALREWLLSLRNNPYFQENEFVREVSLLKPKERFLAFASHISLYRIREGLDPDSFWLPIPDDSLQMLQERCLEARQKQVSIRLIPVIRAIGTPGEELIPIAKAKRGAKEVKINRSMLLVNQGKLRSLGTCYTSQWLLPLVWAEILHCVKENIPAQICKTCGKIFVANSPKQDYRQIYCTPECRKKADTAQEREAQRLYKQYKRGKLTAKEYIKEAKSKGLPVIGAKRGKLKAFLKTP